MQEGRPMAGNFRVESAEDIRPLQIRIRGSRGLVRVELVNGFQPGARYHFRYLPAHGVWQHPDHLTVAIDNGVVHTAGEYAIKLAPRPIYKVSSVPTSSGSCFEPSPAVVQEFTYAIPAQLANYREFLSYAVDDFTVLRPKPPKPPKFNFIAGWPYEPELYDSGWAPGSASRVDPEYSAQRNAVRAACGNRLTRVRMSGMVGFPEVDDKFYRTAAVQFDMRANVEGGCGELEALLRTMRNRPPERVLRQVCGTVLGSDFKYGGIGLADVGMVQWTLALSFLYQMSPTCNIVALAHLWQAEQNVPDAEALKALAAALQPAFERADPALRNQTAHALAYLAAELPESSRRRVAPPLLTPLIGALIEDLESSHPNRPDELARLILWGGALPPALRLRVQAIAGGRTSAAPHAKVLLAGLPR
ncbi:hypothetical protein C7C56_023825 [Massilia glaciei]|uniref:Uncharacterized protein n=2 Tax=Massilia glaciei TaxID=1524097 RepID=A0A2U2HEC3_9BURK|nr:hypothetical protein C7C56_023825 [Massilia glaciei]